MRTIKFRGKEFDSGEWLLGALMPNNKTYVCIAPFRKLLQLERVNHETVGQYIGILDKNGKEIYEGDIITVKGDYPRVVLWDKMMWALMPTVYYHDKDFWVMNIQHPGVDWWEEYADEIEVIGNMYDNPEMLSTLA